MKAFKEKVKELKIVKLQGTYYLGVVEDDIITDAINCAQSFKKIDIERWFRCYNLGDLYEEIKLVRSAGYTVRSFNIKEARHVDQCLLVMEDAKKLALLEVENNYFKEAMEK